MDENVSIIKSINTETQDKSIKVSLLSLDGRVPLSKSKFCDNIVKIEDFKHISEIAKLRLSYMNEFDLTKILLEVKNLHFKKIELDNVFFCDSVLDAFRDLIRQNDFVESVVIIDCKSRDDNSLSYVISEISRDPKISDFSLHHIFRHGHDNDYIHELAINHNVKELNLSCLDDVTNFIPSIIKYISDDNVLQSIKITYGHSLEKQQIKHLFDVIAQKTSLKKLYLMIICDIDLICDFIEMLNQNKSSDLYDIKLTYNPQTKNINFERLIVLLEDNYAVKSILQFCCMFDNTTHSTEYIINNNCPDDKISEIMIRNNNLDQEKKFKYTKHALF